jgi:hypothetical protein
LWGKTWRLTVHQYWASITRVSAAIAPVADHGFMEGLLGRVGAIQPDAD